MEVQQTEPLLGLAKSSKCSVDIMLWAKSGWGKTTQIFNLADSLYKEKGLKTRLISCSGGGWEVGQAWVDAGIVQATHLERRPHTFEALNLLTEGWWPSDHTDPNSPLAPPPMLASRYPNLSVPPQTQESWDEVGMVAFDSLSEICGKMMRHGCEKGAIGEAIAADTAKSMTKFFDGDQNFGVATRGMYGTIQNYAEQYVAQTKGLSGKIVIWTALSSMGEEKITRNTIYGPEVVGQARTEAAKAWCSNCLYGKLHESIDDGRKKISRRLYLKPHFDDFGTLFVAKNSVNFMVQETIPEYLDKENLDSPAKWDDQPRGLVKFLKLLDEANSVASSHIQIGG